MLIRFLNLASDQSRTGAAAALAPRFAVAFGAGAPTLADVDATLLQLPIPWLGGATIERFAGGTDLGFGAELEPLTGGIGAATERAYARMLQRVGTQRLCRIWNFVPGINQTDPHEGMETYRSFCRARARAFESAWGSGFTQALPAASAVGGAGDRLAIVFAASPHAPHVFENPEQVPAYEYPPEHGPRSPSFSRAARLTGLAGEWLFVSGTAAIKDHRTVAPGQLEPQIACTLDNLRLIGTASGAGPDLGAASGWQRQFKVYLRHAQDWPAVKAALEGTLFHPGDHVIWLHAEICRAELEIEIEATLSRAR